MRAFRTYDGVVDDNVARRLEQSLDQFMLRRNRDSLCNPVIAVAPAGVDRQTYPLLTTLARLGPLPAARLAEEVGIDRSGASRYADRLQAAGLLDRSPDPQDRRSMLLCLTPVGNEVIRHLRNVLAGHLGQLISTWPAGQAEALIEGIALLIGAPGPALELSADTQRLVS